MNKFFVIALTALAFVSCTKGTNERYLILKVKFDPTSAPLNDSGFLYATPVGNGALTPTYNSMAPAYIELAPDLGTPDSTVPYKSDFKYTLFSSENATDNFGHSGVRYTSLQITKDGEAMVSIPLNTITPGTYRFLRLAVAYQNFDILYKLDSTVSNLYHNGTLYPSASFYGMYHASISAFSDSTFFDNGFTVSNYTVNNMPPKTVKKSGFYGFETQLGTNSFYYPLEKTSTLQVADSVASVNTIYAKVKTPKNASVFTAPFYTINFKNYTQDTIMTPLVITGGETESIIIDCTMITKNSFEWKNDNGNGVWDAYSNKPGAKNEGVYNFGFRGMKPFYYKGN